MKKIKLLCLFITLLFSSIASSSIWARGGNIGGYYFGGGHDHYGGYYHYGGHHFDRHHLYGRHHHHGEYGLRWALVGLDGGRWPYYGRDSSPHNGVYGLGYGGGYYPLVIYMQQEDSEEVATESQSNDWSNWSEWYWCGNPEGYYPYVKKCLDEWIPVAP